MLANGTRINLKDKLNLYGICIKNLFKNHNWLNSTDNIG